MTPTSWARRGDFNAFFGLMLDNVAVMVILFSMVTSLDAVERQVETNAIRFTPEFVLTRMIPGTAIGVLLGDLVFTWMAVRLARRTRRSDVTAMPLGIDTPSLFAFTFGIVGPAFILTRNAERAWHISTARTSTSTLTRAWASIATGGL